MKWKITHNGEINVFCIFFQDGHTLAKCKKKKVITVIESGGCFKSGNLV